MAGLNDLEAISTLDREGMRLLIHRFPEQCRQGWETGGTLEIPSGHRNVDKVILVGTGGSAIVGDALADLCAAESGPLVVTHRDYNLPAWADERTMVIFSSYSGGTEETVSGFKEAKERGLRAIVLTSGGALAKEAAAASMPVFPITIKAPPRAAFGFTYMMLVRICTRLGLLSDKTQDVAGALDTLRRLQKELGLETPLEGNPAKATAQRLHDFVPIVVSAGVLRAAGRRWKNQFNENAKLWALHEELPEMDHNAIMAAEAPSPIRDQVAAVFLHSTLLGPRVRTRYDATEALLRAYGTPTERIHAQGDSALAHILSAIFYGDWVSFYLAAQYDIDPTPIGPISALKERLARE
jgi:glucose/mannose-6-phosphate isomerase